MPLSQGPRRAQRLLILAELQAAGKLHGRSNRQIAAALGDGIASTTIGRDLRYLAKAGNLRQVALDNLADPLALEQPRPGLLSAAEVRALIRRHVAECGGQAEFARRASLSRHDLNRILRGHKLPTRRLLRRLGLKRVVMYESKKPRR